MKLARQEKTFKDENQQLADDYKRITEQLHDLQRKSKHFMLIDNQNFRDVWCLNEEECKKLAAEVLDVDRCIHEQQLGLPWSSPDLTFMENVGPLTNTDKKKLMSATKILQEVMSASNTIAEINASSHAAAALYNKISPLAIKRVLELLCNEAGFLVEEKLAKLLTPLEKDEQSLMKLDSIFSALGLETEEDIHKMSLYFMNIRELKEETNQSPKEAESSSDESVDTELEHIEKEKESSIRDEAVDLIHPNQVLKAMRAFVEDTRKGNIGNTDGQTNFHLTLLEQRDDAADREYWEKYTTVLSSDKEILWDSLLKNMEKYYEILQGRAGLLTEMESLKQQNAELRLLLQQYIQSKVNTELQIPPTRVLQLELNPAMTSAWHQ